MRSIRGLTRLSRTLLTQAASSQAASTSPAIEQQTWVAIANSAPSSSRAQPSWRAFAAEATPSKIDKFSGEDIGHDSPYTKPKEGAGTEGTGADIPWDPEHVNIGNECDKILLQSAEKDGVPGILKEIEMHGMSFNDNNIATAFEQLALQRGSLADDKVQAELFDRTPFKSLVEMAKIETENFNPRQLADITASLGKLKFQDAGLLSNLIARTASKLGELDAEHLSKLSDGLAGSTAAGLSDLYKHVSGKK